MKLFKIAIIWWVINLSFNLAWAMEEEFSNKKELSLDLIFNNEILPIILHEFSLQDWFHFLPVSKSWQDAIEKKFLLMVKNMKNWEAMEVKELTEEINFSRIEKVLIRYLEKQLLLRSSTLVVKTNEDLAAFLFAHHFVNLPFAWLIARDTAMNAEIDAKNAAMDSDWYAAVSAFMDADKYSSYYRAWYGLWHADQETLFSVIFNTAKEAADSNVKIAVEKCKDNTCDDVDVIAFRLSNLYTLAFMSQPSSIENYFIKAQKLTKQIFNIDTGFNLSIDEIINLKCELENNPYILSIKRMAETIVSNAQASL